MIKEVDHSKEFTDSQLDTYYQFATSNTGNVEVDTGILARLCEHITYLKNRNSVQKKYPSGNPFYKDYGTPP